VCSIREADSGANEWVSEWVRVIIWWIHYCQCDSIIGSPLYCIFSVQCMSLMPLCWQSLLLHATNIHYSATTKFLASCTCMIKWYAVCHCSLHRSVTVIGRGLGQADYTLYSVSRIQNLYVSRIHARIVHTDGTYYIHDDSRNGIFVNNVKIDGLCICVLAL